VEPLLDEDSGREGWGEGGTELYGLSNWHERGSVWCGRPNVLCQL